MYAYCLNNPVVFKDSNGLAVETVFDIVSLCVSVVDVCVNPTDLWAWVGLVGDAVDLIPFVCGVGEITRTVKIGNNIAETADTLGDTGKIIDTTTDAIKSDTKPLHRPYIRKATREAIEAAANKLPDGRFLDANTNIPINGKYDIGHIYGHEFWRERNEAMVAGMTQKMFNDYMNNPSFYQIEDPRLNRSHIFEKK